MKKTTTTFAHTVLTLLLLATISLLSTLPSHAQAPKSFKDLNEVLDYAKSINLTFTNASIQSKLAILTRKTAWGNVINPRIPTSFQMIDNTKQQVIFLPGEAFGQPGTFRSVTTGQKYSTLFSLQPQFEILNLAAIAQVQSAKINQALTENQNQITEKNLYDQINAVYHNILSYKAQIAILDERILTADTIWNAAQNRFTEQVGRQQEVNEAAVNRINLQNNREQLHYNLQIQEESLALFFENKGYPVLEETVWAYENSPYLLHANNPLPVKNAELKLQKMEQDIKVAKAQHWPTVSFVSSFNWQSLSNDFFFHSNSNAIDYNYIGLKVSMDLPTNVNKYATLQDKKYQRSLLENDMQQLIHETETNNRKLILEYEKSLSQLDNFQKIVILKEDTYRKNYNQYLENILSLDDLLISYNNMLAAQLNVVTALATIGYNKSKIDINNKF